MNSTQPSYRVVPDINPHSSLFSVVRESEATGLLHVICKGLQERIAEQTANRLNTAAFVVHLD